MCGDIEEFIVCSFDYIKVWLVDDGFDELCFSGLLMLKCVKIGCCVI